MTLDIRGSLKNTKINHNYYVVIDELLSNSIDSYLIRKNKEPSSKGLEVTLLVELSPKDLHNTQFDLKITCTDNGAGFGDEQTKAFITKDSSYKDDLFIGGIGKCKGSGRIQFLHYFSKLEIDSVYSVNGKLNKRSLRVNETVKEIDKRSFTVEDTNEIDTKTSVTLDIIKKEVCEKIFSDKNLPEKFSTSSLKKYVMVSFLQRFVSLKKSLGDFSISFITKMGDEHDQISLVVDELPEITEEKKVNVFYNNSGNITENNYETFKVSHYKLDKLAFELTRNTVALCAKSSTVKFITKRYLRTKTLENNPVNGFYHIVLIESDYLDDKVNEQREGFNIPAESQSTDNLFENLISFGEIYDALENVIINMLAPPDWDRQDIVKRIENKFGISAGMIADTNIRVRYGDSEESVVKRVLSSYQEKIIEDTSKIFDIKEEVINADPNSEEFREKVNDLAWKYTSSLKVIDMANLSQLVVRRAAIIEILDLAVNKNLNVQDLAEGERREDEKIIHNIFFPMHKDSDEVTDHDVWILNEEYHYYDYIASDKSLSKIKWSDNTFLFENDIDEELEKILKSNYKKNSLKRPDIAIFNNEGSAIIVEFKSPGVSMDAHIGDLMEYAQLLAAKSNGKLKKFYGYLIGTDVNPNRLTGYTRFPSNKGWFNTSEIIEHTTGKRMGEVYSEILYYEDIVHRAKQRLDVYKSRLGVEV